MINLDVFLNLYIFSNVVKNSVYNFLRFSTKFIEMSYMSGLLNSGNKIFIISNDLSNKILNKLILNIIKL